MSSRSRRATANPALTSLRNCINSEIVGLWLRLLDFPNAIKSERGRAIVAYAAAAAGIVDILHELIALEWDVNSHPSRGMGLIEVIRAGKAAELQMLLDKGLGFNEPTFLSPHHRIVDVLSLSNEAVLNIFLQNGYNTQFGSTYDDQDFKLVVARGNIAFVRLLIARGINLSDNPDSASILIFVASGDDDQMVPEIVDILLQEGLNIEATNLFGQTALLQTILNELDWHGSAAVRILLERGANPCTRRIRGDTAMCPLVAVAQDSEYPKIETARALLQAIDDQKIPYEIVEPQILKAIEVAEQYEKKPVPGVLGVLRRWYWRRKYPVDL
ncbi:hypothetical protein BJX70DRAFT_397519 [Aspergillus crustosus]